MGQKHIWKKKEGRGEDCAAHPLSKTYMPPRLHFSRGPGNSALRARVAGVAKQQRQGMRAWPLLAALHVGTAAWQTSDAGAVAATGRRSGSKRRGVRIRGPCYQHGAPGAQACGPGAADERTWVEQGIC